MYQMIDDEARHSICQKSRQCVEILEIQHNNQKVSVIVMSLWRCKEGCISEIGVNVLSLEERDDFIRSAENELEPDAVGDD